MKKKTNFLLRLLLILIIPFIFFGYFLYALTIPLNITEQELYIHSNSEFSIIHKSLEEKDLIKNKYVFFIISSIKKLPELFKPGYYLISSQTNMIQLVNTLRSGNQTPVNISFHNIDNIEKLCGRISIQIEADSVDLLNVFTKKSFLEENNFTLETLPALFIPNTYELYWNISVEQFSKKILHEYNTFWNKKRLEKVKQIGLSKIKISTLASIIEKETFKNDEMPIIAGLYLNRLEKNWKLQSDPTVIFSIKKDLNKDTIIKRVLYSDLKHESPFNTYLNTGLPPGPICIPSVSAIDAVLNPANHDYLYMCASVEKFGYHEFAENSLGHKKNKKQYIEWLNTQNIRR